MIRKSATSHHVVAVLFVLVLSTGLPSICAHARTPFQSSHHYIETGQYTEARRALRSELRKRPKNLAARYNLAILLEDMKHQDEALALYEENLSYAWHLPSVVNMAAILQQQGKTEQARNWLIKATKALKFEATPWYLLAAMAERNGRATEAEKLYAKAIKADPLNGFAYLHFAAFQSAHKLSDKGLKYSHKAIRLLPDCAPCWQQHGEILQAAGKNQQALAAFQRSLAIRPDAGVRQRLINVLRDLGQIKRAEHMQQALNVWRRYQKVNEE